jgi:curved DNA-binding protein
MSHYSTLGLDETATQDDIKKAYRKLAMQYHPDTNAGDKNAEEQFKQIAEAYSTLGDSQKKVQYDSMRSASAFHENFNFSFDHTTWSQAFDQTFGSRGQKRGQDVVLSATIDMKEAYTGTIREFQLGDKRYKISIKRGVENGQKLRIRGKGNKHPLNPNSENGDLIIVVTVLNDGTFIRRGQDLYIDMNVHIYKLLAGGQINIPTPEGDLIYEIERGHGLDSIILQGCGMPYYDSDKKGNLIVKLNAIFPKQYTQEELEIFETLSKKITEV